MHYLVIDAFVGGTGLRDYYEGGYIEPDNLSLSLETKERIVKWLSNYHDEFYKGFENKQFVDELDEEGKVIALLVKKELLEAKVTYFSDAKMIQMPI